MLLREPVHIKVLLKVLLKVLINRVRVLRVVKVLTVLKAVSIIKATVRVVISILQVQGEHHKQVLYMLSVNFLEIQLIILS